MSIFLLQPSDKVLHVLLVLIMHIYSRAMKTQHLNVHQYFNDILNILLQRISGVFMNTKDRQNIGFISFNVKCSNIYTHAHVRTVLEYQQSYPGCNTKDNELLVMWYELSGILTLISLIKLF